MQLKRRTLGAAGGRLLRARKVLDDCRRATALADSAASGQDLRVFWVAAISLARAVGHVLRNVDALEDPAVAEANRLAFAAWRSNRSANAVYWDFVCAERNLVLKQYELNWQYDPSLVIADGELFELDAGLYCAIDSGPFAGADIRDMLDIAIEWWNRQLDWIEADALSRRAAPAPDAAGTPAESSVQSDRSRDTSSDGTEQCMSNPDLAALLERVKQVAREYRDLTERPLGCTGEIAELEATAILGLDLAEVRQAGYDAIRRGPDGDQRIQIKGRCILPSSKPGQRLGNIDLKHEWDSVMLVLLDANLNATAIYEADRSDVIAAIEAPGSKARNERGSLGIPKFKSIGRLVWAR